MIRQKLNILKNIYLNYHQEILLIKQSAEPTAQWQKRECFSKIHDYVYGNSTDRVFILYGLRRTGKTTLIRQLIAEMSGDMLEKTAFMQVNSTSNLARMNLDLKRLSDLGYRYILFKMQC